MDSRSIGGTVVALVIAAGLVGYQFHKKDKTNEEYRQKLHAFVAECDCYDASREYLDGLCDQAHDKAFQDAYRMGGRRTSTKFDADQYVDEAMTFILEQARKDGRKEVVASLERFGGIEPEPAKAKPPAKREPYKGGRG